MAIKNGQSRDIGNIRHTRHITKTNKVVKHNIAENGKDCKHRLLLDPSPPPFVSEKRKLPKYPRLALISIYMCLSLIENDVDVFKIGNTFNFNNETQECNMVQMNTSESSIIRS